MKLPEHWHALPRHTLFVLREFWVVFLSDLCQDFVRWWYLCLTYINPTWAHFVRQAWVTKVKKYCQMFMLNTVQKEVSGDLVYLWSYTHLRILTIHGAKTYPQIHFSWLFCQIIKQNMSGGLFFLVILTPCIASIIKWAEHFFLPNCRPFCVKFKCLKPFLWYAMSLHCMPSIKRKLKRMKEREKKERKNFAWETRLAICWHATETLRVEEIAHYVDLMLISFPITSIYCWKSNTNCKDLW